MSEQTAIPGPKGGIFGLGNLMEFQKQPLHFLMHIAHDYDDIIHFKFGPQHDMYLVTHPEYLRELMVKQWTKTHKWERQMKIGEKITGWSLFGVEGDEWRQRRKLVAPAFHTQRIKNYIDLMVHHTEEMIADWSDDSVHDVRGEMFDVTMGIIAEILFDIKDVRNEAAELHEALNVLLDMFVAESMAVMPVPDWVPTPRNLRENRAQQVADRYVMNIIRERRVSGEDCGDVLSALLNAVDEDNGETLTDREVRNDLLGLFIAGHETTAILLTWTLYLLAKHPDAQQQLYEEVCAVMQDDTPSLDDLSEMHYTDKVLKESMRLYPPAWMMFIREAVEPITLGEHTLPEKSLIIMSPWVMHHDPRYWDDPQRFDPERFADNWKDDRPAYAYMPFGGGAKVCLGSHMAEMETEVILATMIKHYKFSLIDPDQVVDPEARFTVHPEDGLNLRVEKRS